MRGRNTICNDELIAKAENYVQGGWREVGDLIPSIAGLACELGCHRETLRLWSKDETHPFFGIIENLLGNQERALLNGGLGGDMNPTISKVILTKHGYTDASTGTFVVKLPDDGSGLL